MRAWFSVGCTSRNNVHLRNLNRVHSFRTASNHREREVSNARQSLKKATTDQSSITNLKFNFKILILSSEIKYLVTSTMDRGIRIENPK